MPLQSIHVVIARDPGVGAPSGAVLLETADRILLEDASGVVLLSDGH